MSIEDKVLELLVEICGTKRVKKDLSIDLVQGGYLDSMGIVSLLTSIEDEFNVEIPLDTFDISNFSTASKIIKFIETQIQ